jgi:anti-anti-sigma factor
MNFEATVHDDASLVKLSGDIDLACAAALSILEKELAHQDNIVIDVACLKNVDSTFLRFLSRLKQRITKEGPTSVALVGVSPKLRRLFRVTGLAHMFALSPAA